MPSDLPTSQGYGKRPCVSVTSCNFPIIGLSGCLVLEGVSRYVFSPLAIIKKKTILFRTHVLFSFSFRFKGFYYIFLYLYYITTSLNMTKYNSIYRSIYYIMVRAHRLAYGTDKNGLMAYMAYPFRVVHNESYNRNFPKIRFKNSKTRRKNSNVIRITSSYIVVIY